MTEMSLKATTKKKKQKRIEKLFFAKKKSLHIFPIPDWYGGWLLLLLICFPPSPHTYATVHFWPVIVCQRKIIVIVFCLFYFFIIVVAAATGWLSPCWNNKRRYGTRYLSLFVANHWSNAVAVAAALVTATRHRYIRALHWHQCMPVHRLRTTGCCVAWWMLATRSFRLPEWLTDWLADIEKNFNNNHYNWTRQWKIQLVAVCV